ncbi:transposable element Tcb1 transposase [Trichonephila clavipes]|nr:transposable element Tcb1 transposase [Trichonephila clavipes]
MSYPGFEPKPYGTAVNVTHHYIGWATNLTDVFAKFSEDGNTERRVESQWLPITSSQEDIHVTRRMALMDRTATSRALSQELKLFARQVSTRTVRRRLQQHGLSAQRPWLRLPLKLHHRQERLQSVINDEPRHMNDKTSFFQMNPGSVCSIKMSHPCLAPCETLRFSRIIHVNIVRTFLDTKNVCLLPWTARSSDLSPIENVWSMVAEQLACHYTPITTVDEMWHRVEAAWASVPVHAIHSLFDSKPRRISTVNTARGG